MSHSSCTLFHNAIWVCSNLFVGLHKQQQKVVNNWVAAVQCFLWPRQQNQIQLSAVAAVKMQIGYPIEYIVVWWIKIPSLVATVSTLGGYVGLESLESVDTLSSSFVSLIHLLLTWVRVTPKPKILRAFMQHAALSYLTRRVQTRVLNSFLIF